MFERVVEACIAAGLVGGEGPPDRRADHRGAFALGRVRS
jgi:hypothetical protein